MNRRNRSVAAAVRLCALVVSVNSLVIVSCRPLARAGEPRAPSAAEQKLSEDLRIGSYGPYGHARQEGRVAVVVFFESGGAIRLRIAPRDLISLAALSGVVRIELDYGQIQS